MHSSSVNERARLLRPWTLPLVVASTCGLLAYIYHDEKAFLTDIRQPDSVSISFTELLLGTQPNNDRLRAGLIEQFLRLGEYRRAQEHVSLLKDQAHGIAPFYRAEIAILEARAAPGGLAADQVARLTRGLRELERRDLPAALLARLALHALALGAPDLAAQTYADLAEREPQRRQQWLEEAAHSQLASNQPERAAQLFLDLAEQSTQAEQRRQYLEQAFGSLVAANRSEQAVDLLKRHLAELNDTSADLAWLEQGVSAAMGSKRFDLAADFVERWQALSPEDLQAQRLSFRLQLASGDTAKAWEIGERLLQRQPDDPALLEQMARLGEWTGHPQRALDYWVSLLQQREDAQQHEHAWRLAAQLFDFDRAVPLLARLGEQRRLSDVELDALIYSHESRGSPEQAEQWLRGYLAQHPDHRLAWMRLQQNLAYTEQFKEEALVWAEMARHFPLSPAERVAWAETHKKLFDSQGAWQVLSDVDSEKIEDADYWRLRAELAWELEHDQEALRAYDRLQALQQPLYSGNEEHLIALNSQRNPEKALALLAANWRRTGDMRRLVSALQMAESLNDWEQLQRLLGEVQDNPQAARTPYVWVAQAALADHQGREAEAEGLYRRGMERFPEESLFCERLLWFYVDRGRRRELEPLLQQWRGEAIGDSRLWLPFASANLLLGRHSEALAWYRRYLQANPRDWLVKAAYADALEASGYPELALRVRHELLAELDNGDAKLTPERYSTYLRLLASSHSIERASRQVEQWQDGSPLLLQQWFERFLIQLEANNQEGLKNEWLAWGRGRGLAISRYEELQEALRSHNRSTLQHLMTGAELDSAQRVDVLQQLGHDGPAMVAGLEAMGDGQPPQIQQQLLGQTQELLQRSPQGLQVGWHRRDYGEVNVSGPRLSGGINLGDDWYAALRLEDVNYSANSLKESRMGDERNAQLSLRRNLADGDFTLTQDSSWRVDKNRFGLSINRNWQLSSRDEVKLDLDWHRETDETGLLRALGRRDSLHVSGQHGFSARDRVSWLVGHRRYSTREGDSLGKGEIASIELNHSLLFAGPTWEVRSGVEYQNNRLANDLPEELLESMGGPLRRENAKPGDILQDSYGQAYVGSTWRRGLPGTLNRGQAQYTWIVDVMAGWQWTEKQINYGFNTGIGMSVLGGDELAFTVGYLSSPQGARSQSGGVIGVTYSSRFGR